MLSPQGTAEAVAELLGGQRLPPLFLCVRVSGETLTEGFVSRLEACVFVAGVRMVRVSGGL